VRISIIIPVYNTKCYLPKCLDSLRDQTYPNWEAILVDDGSPDGAGVLCDAYAAMDSRFRVIHQENRGLSGARNAGLALVSGNYIGFLDSDDFYHPQCLQLALEALKVANSDLVIFHYTPFYEPDYRGKIREFPPMKPGTYNRDDFLMHLNPPEDWVYSPAWCKLYSAEIFRELRFTPGVYHEDEAIFHQVLKNANSLTVLDSSLYHYRQRAGSIMGSFARSSRWCASYLEVCRRLSAQAQTMEHSAARRALEKRVGQIALSVAKNIPAYRLPEQIAAEAKRFLKENLKELTGYALKSGDALVAAQGWLLRLSPEGFLKLYKNR